MAVFGRMRGQTQRSCARVVARGPKTCSVPGMATSGTARGWVPTGRFKCWWPRLGIVRAVGIGKVPLSLMPMPRDASVSDMRSADTPRASTAAARGAQLWTGSLPGVRFPLCLTDLGTQSASCRTATTRRPTSSNRFLLRIKEEGQSRDMPVPATFEKRSSP